MRWVRGGEALCTKDAARHSGRSNPKGRKSAALAALSRIVYLLHVVKSTTVSKKNLLHAIGKKIYCMQ